MRRWGRVLKSLLIGLLFLVFLGSLSVVLPGCRSNSYRGEDLGNAGESVGKQVHHQIVGIDPGSGVMKKAASALKVYGLDRWEVIEGSDAAMTASLKRAYRRKKPIIITGWTPHWMFITYSLKYLKDPKGVFGKEETIHTIARKGLQKDHPFAYQFLKRFHWETKDMEQVMMDMAGGMKPAKAAARWVSRHPEKVNQWVRGIKPVKGATIHLAYAAWDSAIASTFVTKTVLSQKLGYKVELNQVEPGPMWAGIASGKIDAIVTCWLPTTSADYVRRFKGQFDDLGPNLVGTRMGFVVPSYMELDSIGDLKE